MLRLPQYRIIKKNGKFIPQRREFIFLWTNLYVPPKYRIMTFDTLEDAKKFIDKRNLIMEDIRVLKGNGVICYR